MAKCAGCRVRHRACDTHSPCKECEKNGRQCLRLNVRFRNLVCPSAKVSRAEYSKYEFFFDVEQTWVDTNGDLEFVAGGDSSDDASVMGEQGDDVCDMVEAAAQFRPDLIEESCVTDVPRSTYHTPTAQAPIPDDDPPDYLVALEQTSHDLPFDVPIDNTPPQTSRRASPPEEELALESDVFRQGVSSSARKVALPLKSLQEAKLFQHFITHLAPWVCRNSMVLCD
jgi:hypothetical protein